MDEEENEEDDEEEGGGGGGAGGAGGGGGAKVKKSAKGGERRKRLRKGGGGSGRGAAANAGAPIAEKLPWLDWPDWVQFKSSRNVGAPFYYNTKTGASQHNLPEGESVLTLQQQQQYEDWRSEYPMLRK